MPLYEYECDSCGHRFERIQKFSDPLVDSCPKCGGTVRKLLSSPAIQFKGSGWYITDYAKKGGSAESSSSESPAKADAGDKKPETSDKPSAGSAESPAAKPTGS